MKLYLNIGDFCSLREMIKYQENIDLKSIRNFLGEEIYHKIMLRSSIKLKTDVIIDNSQKLPSLK